MLSHSLSHASRTYAALRRRRAAATNALPTLQASPTLPSEVRPNALSMPLVRAVSHRDPEGTLSRAKHIAIVTPVLDDWESLRTLVNETAALFASGDILFHFVAVDDGSSSVLDQSTIALPSGSCIAELSVIRLALNLGHQRAIATGLCAVVNRADIDAVIVMDSDGEDRPADLAVLLAAGKAHPDHIVMAHRAKRSETLAFRLGYHTYKLMFRILTGQSISFGNFSLLPRDAVKRLVHMPELWNNLAAAIMRSRIRYTTVATQRGERYFGRSRMNLAALVVHGLSAMSIYIDIVFVRILLTAAVVAILSFLAIVCVTIIRMATHLAIPGWTTTVVGDLVIVLLQTAVLVVATSLMVLSNRSSPPIVPIRDHRAFLLNELMPDDGALQSANTSHHEF